MALLWAAAERDRQQRSTYETKKHSHNAEPRPESLDEKNNRELKERVKPICESIRLEIKQQCNQLSKTKNISVSAEPLYLYEKPSIGKYVSLELKFLKYSGIWFNILPYPENASISINRIEGTTKHLSKLIPDTKNQFTAEYTGLIAEGFSEYMKPILKMITALAVVDDQYFPDITNTINDLVSFTSTLVKHKTLWFKETFMFTVEVTTDGFISIRKSDESESENISTLTDLVLYMTRKTNIPQNYRRMMTVFDQELDKLILLQDPVQLHALLKEFECKLDQLILLS